MGFIDKVATTVYLAVNGNNLINVMYYAVLSHEINTVVLMSSVIVTSYFPFVYISRYLSFVYFAMAINYLFIVITVNNNFFLNLNHFFCNIEIRDLPPSV